MNDINTPGAATFSAGLFIRNAGHDRVRRRAISGFSLIELLIALALSLIIMTGLLALFANISRTNSETVKSNELIENGRFAIQLLQNDLMHAGFWGDIQPLAATAVPAPCLSYANWPTGAAARNAYGINLMAIPVQGYAKGSALADCGIAADKVVDQSSMLVVRYANTCTFGESGCSGGADTGPHLQLSGCRSGLPAEAPYVFGVPAGSTAEATYTLKTKNCTTVAPRRKMVVNIYYVGLSEGANGVDYPNLMRVSFDNGAYSTPEPLVEGIEAFQVEYGVDNVGANKAQVSADNPGDGNADSYVTCPAAGCELAALANVATVRLHVLSRNTLETPGYTNATAYKLGSLAIPAFNDHYKRHVFSTTVRLVNIASRREKQSDI